MSETRKDKMSEAPRKRLRKKERQSRIVSDLRLVPTLRVHEIAENLQVSQETIRRDLAELENRNLISRTYGGAVRQDISEPALIDREQMLATERAQIGSTAAQMIENEDVVMFGGGATTVHVARQLVTRPLRLTIITHSFKIAQILAVNADMSVIILPGFFDAREGIVVGSDTVDALSRFRANKAVLGASGLSAEGPSDASLTGGHIYSTMMARAIQTLLVADHTKFDRQSLYNLGPWAANLTLVTDKTPSQSLGAAIGLVGSRYVVASDSAAE
jgi:DeoR/GlpR family transcriptional regulator of sugar metabolism